MVYDSELDEYDDETLPCPHCGEHIFDDADQCPYCRQYISPADFRKQTPTWIIVLIILTIVSFLLPSLMTAIRLVTDQ